MMERCRAVPKRRDAGWLDLPENLKPRNLLRRRLHWKGYFNTILIKPAPYWSAVFHPNQYRVISVRESARAQVFPDKVSFFGGISAGYAQIKYTVPPR
jgi:DNA (cytosine-5)-methyltransferase 1